VTADSPVAGLDDGQIRQLLNVGASFAALQVVADVIEKTAFDDDDVEAIGWLPIGVRTHTLARIIDAAEAIREELREIDGRVLVLTGSTEA
jgi:hypothetical protein